MNEHMIPVLITDLVEQFKKAARENEFFNLQQRLEAIRDYINEALLKKKSFSRK